MSNKIIFLLILLQFPLLLLSQSTPEPVQFKEIADHLYLVTGGRGANSAVFIGNNAVLVIDAKMTREHVDTTIAEIKKRSNNPIKYLINSHSDGDHITGNRYFPQSTIFIAHENCRNDFFHPKRDGSTSEWNDPALRPFVPSITFKNHMDIFLGDIKVELYYFGVGHTTGDAVVYFPHLKTAFIGDQVFYSRPQLIHSYKGGNSFEHVKTLTTMLNTLDAEYFYTGHSDVLDRQAIENHILSMMQIQKKIQSLIEKQKPLSDIQKEFDDNQGRLVEAIYNEIID